MCLLDLCHNCVLFSASILVQRVNGGLFILTQHLLMIMKISYAKPHVYNIIRQQLVQVYIEK